MFPNFDNVSGFAGNSYVQVLHTGADHWIAINVVSDKEVYIYDSLFSSQPTYYTMKQIAAIVKSNSHQISLFLEKVQGQRNSFDCGIYAIAFITDLCHGINPATHQYSSSKELRQHLVNCFSNGSMSPFPIVASKEHKLAIKATLNVYCCCRLPYVLDHLLPINVPADDITTEMVKCGICDNWYHCSCVNLSDEQVKQLKDHNLFGCVTTEDVTLHLVMFLAQIQIDYL